jgi:MFS family permease
VLLPPETHPAAARLLCTRGLRAFGDGYVSLLLPFYLSLLGLSALEIGIIASITLLGSASLTLTVGLLAHRFRSRTLLLAASLLMLATGVAFIAVTDFWPLLIIALVGTLNPSAGDISVFLPLEQSLLARATSARSRTALFARYSLIGALVGAIGSQAAAVPALVAHWSGIDIKAAIQGMFLLYGALGLASFVLFRGLSPRLESTEDTPTVPLGKSRRMVFKLAALFSLDSFGGGFAVQSLLALWLYQRFDLSVTDAATIFFWLGILGALSQLAAPKIAERFGLINTMVFTHLPSNIFCVLVPLMPTLPLALLFLMLRATLQQMDVPTRTSYVMAVVSPGERPAAASITAVPRTLTAAISPTIAGYLLTLSSFGWPLVFCGVFKIVYDLTLLRMFGKVKPPEEAQEK